MEEELTLDELHGWLAFFNIKKKELDRDRDRKDKGRLKKEPSGPKMPDTDVPSMGSSAARSPPRPKRKAR